MKSDTLPDGSVLRRCEHCTVVLHWTDRGGRGPIRIFGVGDFCSERCQKAHEAQQKGDAA